MLLFLQNVCDQSYTDFHIETSSFKIKVTILRACYLALVCFLVSGSRQFLRRIILQRCSASFMDISFYLDNLFLSSIVTTFPMCNFFAWSIILSMGYIFYLSFSSLNVQREPISFNWMPSFTSWSKRIPFFSFPKWFALYE